MTVVMADIQQQAGPLNLDPFTSCGVATQAAVELGAPENGSELLSLVAGVGCSQESSADKSASRVRGSRLQWRTADFEGLAPHFSRAEMQQLLERERGTALLLLRGSEAM